MRDLVLSFLISGTVVMGATEMMGITDVLHGQDPSAAVRSAVPDFPAMPHLPELIPDAARSMFSGSANAAPDPDASATATAAPDTHPMYIARTGGTGVRARAACLDDAPGQGVASEGSAVTILRLGGRECPGWAFVTNGKSQFWVRMTYLDASPPKPPAKPTDVTKPAGPKPPDQEQRSDKDDAARDDAKPKDQENSIPPPTPTSTATPTEEPRDDES